MHRAGHVVGVCDGGGVGGGEEGAADARHAHVEDVGGVEDDGGRADHLVHGVRDLEERELIIRFFLKSWGIGFG